ncbi:MAG: aspartate-semialdehyde dehydrogenase [Acidobacteria bacterium]|nr:aspartate-semialdehyde dehydrogenase [Acidobacteriota bacterium]
MERRVEVGVLGATGMVGQQFISFLQGHPWFDVTWLGASERSAGKKYMEAANWTLDGKVPASIAAQTVHEAKPVAGAPKLMFSAMDASVAGEIEQAFAAAGHFIVSNSRNHRMEPDVPLLIPEINADHLGILPAQRKNRGWAGAIVTNPNCSTITLALGLAPLKQFGIKKILLSTMQAISGAGYPGLPSMDIVGNVVPFIKNEEEKMESETQKILGDFADGKIVPLLALVSAHCNRVAVVDGHMIAVSVELEQKPGVAAVAEAMAAYRGVPQEKNLPSAPKQPIHVMTEENRPQPRKDAMLENGMAVSVGRIRECPILDYKMIILAHNTIRGAAGAAVLNAELLLAEGLLD